jgi:hypothetical protein
LIEHTLDVIEVVGCYPVNEATESCHLLELVVKDSPGFDLRGWAFATRARSRRG